MRLTVEGAGTSLNFLESTLSVTPGEPRISLKGPTMTHSLGVSFPSSPQKLLDVFSPNARSMLRSLVPTLVNKAAHYCFPVSRRHFTQNISTIAHTLRAKG